MTPVLVPPSSSHSYSSPVLCLDPGITLCAPLPPPPRRSSTTMMAWFSSFSGMDAFGSGSLHL